jgi:hypothetical protein
MYTTPTGLNAPQGSPKKQYVDALVEQFGAAALNSMTTAGGDAYRTMMLWDMQKAWPQFPHLSAVART